MSEQQGNTPLIEQFEASDKNAGFNTMSDPSSLAYSAGNIPENLGKNFQQAANDVLDNLFGGDDFFDPDSTDQNKVEADLDSIFGEFEEHHPASDQSDPQKTTNRNATVRINQPSRAVGSGTNRVCLAIEALTALSNQQKNQDWDPRFAQRYAVGGANTQAFRVSPLLPENPYLQTKEAQLAFMETYQALMVKKFPIMTPGKDEELNESGSDRIFRMCRTSVNKAYSQHSGLEVKLPLETQLILGVMAANVFLYLLVKSNPKVLQEITNADSFNKFVTAKVLPVLKGVIAEQEKLAGQGRQSWSHVIYNCAQQKDLQF